ncbi:MAG: NAD(P)-dependent oxidoreductase [Erysipelotrichaceae bacterium]
MKVSAFEQFKSEADRCLLCANARCKTFCPIATPIPELIALYREGNIDEVAKQLFENNPLSAFCGVVCAHEDQCAGHCVRGFKGEPIAFHEMEAAISKAYLYQNEFQQAPLRDEHIAIIGSGPAGLTVALTLAMQGYRITIFEKNNQIGGMLRYGIPDFRLDKTLLDRLEQVLVKLNVKIRYNTLVGAGLTVDTLLEDSYKAIFIGTGVWNPKPLHIKGETLGHVHYAVNYLKTPNDFHLGDDVVVIGAGNVAMDAARTAKRNGAKNVTIIYRKDADFMKATKKEIMETEEDGVNFLFYRAPKEINDEGLVLVESRKSIKEDGMSDFTLIEASEEQFAASAILVAISQTTRTHITSSTKNLNTNRWGLLEVDETGHTSREAIFASGDVVTGAKTVVEAVAQAKIVAQSIDEYCKQTV